jgi:hypothetical protein
VTGAGQHIAVYLDSQINLEVGVEMATPFVGFGEVVSSATPSGPVATTTHYTLAGPNWEVYGHWKDEWNSDPAKITPTSIICL